MTESTTEYSSFTIVHEFAAPVEKVYNMFADKDLKESWFKGPTPSESEHTMDFSVGGSEYNKSVFNSQTHEFNAHYFDIVPNERIIYGYEMRLDGKKISVSLASLEFIDFEGSTKLLMHEDGIFLDNVDSGTNREMGSKMLLSALEAALQ